MQRKDLRVITAILEHGGLVSIMLGEIYDELLKIAEEGSRPAPPPEAQPPSS